MRKAISPKHILQQLKADLIGKDSHRGVTLTYAWLANQFGHIALGFIPTSILFIFLSKKNPAATAIWSAVGVSIFWLLFETYNFLGPLLFKRQSRSKLLFVPKEQYIFSPDWENIAFDTFTDLLFFWFGAFLCSLLCFFTSAAFIVLLVILILLVYPSSHWFLTKMYLQIPVYPYQFRLCQWDFKISEKDKNAVKYFLDNRKPGLHLLVYGSKGCGKTSLGVAIATELSIKHHACIYTTAMKLYSMFFESDSEVSGPDFWNWRSASVMVIDDVNPGDPIENDIVSPELFLNFLDTNNLNEENRLVIKNTNIVWILGDKKANLKSPCQWQQMLKNIGVNEEKIMAVNLSE